MKRLLKQHAPLRALGSGLVLAGAVAHPCASADPVEAVLATYCNVHTGEFFISAAGDAPPGDASRYSKQRVDWASLLKVGPRKNQWGDPLRSGSRTKVMRCGPTSISFSSGFLNANPQGELGALDFPVIQVRRANRTILPHTALEQCSVNSARYSHLGECKSSWAQSLEGQLVGGVYQVKVTRQYEDAQYNKVQRVEVLR
ncbi:hypothetical protein [Ideonella margarita]|uniref:Uncharacterized protein n=1 Tax=Ideonella margarita TaxID=2984191 RepID=A0ABU9C822_9BURK